MSEKSIQKKEYIIETAKSVFASKGFKDVTMKDIVDACNISRGGLYLYFDCVESVFRAVIESERLSNDPEEAKLIPQKPCDSDILTLFFREQKKEIMDKRNCLLKALYEFSFIQKEYKQETMLEQQKDACFDFLCEILKNGMDSGEFEANDVSVLANHIIFGLEGMKILNKAGHISEKEIDDELVLIMKSVLKSDIENSLVNE